MFVRMVALITLLNGALNLYAALHPRTQAPHGWLRYLAPLEFLHFPRSWTLLIGFVLIVASVNIWQRKRRAWRLVLTLSGFAALLHALKGHNYQEALLSLVLSGSVCPDAASARFRWACSIATTCAPRLSPPSKTRASAFRLSSMSFLLMLRERRPST